MRLLLPLLLLAGCAERGETIAPSAHKLDGRTIITGCRQGECGWARVVKVETAATFPQGELRRMTMRSGTSHHLNGNLPSKPSEASIEWAAEDQADYAFCSTERPSFAFPDEEGRLIVHFLDLFDLGGYQHNSAVLYMRVCHGLDDLPAEDRLRSLGYRPETRSEQVEADGPEIMTRF